MPRNPTLHTVEEAIIYYTGEYYKKVEEDSRVRYDDHEHIKKIGHINEKYQGALKRIEDCDYEAGKDKFIENIDFLTQAFTKQKKKP